MKRVTSIVAMNTDGVIGCQNQLPWKLGSDMRFFKENTLGQTVVMGRKTYDSIGSPLKGRLSIVLSHNSVLFEQTPMKMVATSVEEALVFAQDAKQGNEIFIIGGASTYSQFDKFVDRYLITIVDKIVTDGDAVFNTDLISDETEWKMKELLSIEKDSVVNEASFKIFELIRRDREYSARVMDDSISNFRSKYIISPSNKSRKRREFYQEPAARLF